MMKGLFGIFTAAVILFGLTSFGRLSAVESSFFDGGISISPKVMLFREIEFAQQFSWMFAFQFGKDIVLNESPYYGDAWKFFLDFGGRFYFNKDFMAGHFINVNLEGGILDVPYYVAFPGYTTTNRYLMEISFGYQVSTGYRWVLGSSRILDINFLYAIEFSAGYNGMFIVSSYSGLRMSHWFQVGIDFVMGFPADLPNTPKTKEKPAVVIPLGTNLPGVSPANTMNTNYKGMALTNKPSLPPQTNQIKPK